MDSVGLAPNKPDPETVKLPAGTRTEPDRVTVRHVLIAFEKTGILSVTRSKDEAERLAQKVFEMAQSGTDFGELVRLYSDDRHGDGTYTIVNWGVVPAEGEMERERMVQGFGTTAFSLEPGQTGIQPYAPVESPFGWHIIRRVK